MKKGLAILAFLMLTFTSCKNTPTASISESSSQPGNTSSQSSTLPSQESTDSALSGSTAAAAFQTGAVTSGNNTTAVTSKTSASKTASTTAAQAEGKFSISLVQYHPGIPGYDATYELYMTNGNSLVVPSDVNLSSDTPNVRFSANKVIVSESVRNTGKAVTVTAVYKKTVLNPSFQSLRRNGTTRLTTSSAAPRLTLANGMCICPTSKATTSTVSGQRCPIAGK